MRDALVAGGNADVQLEVLDGVGHFFEKMYAGYQRSDVVSRVIAWLSPRLALASEGAQLTQSQ